MAELRWTQEAAEWLQDIYQYIAQDNSDAAARTIQAIYEKAQHLKSFPQLGYQYRLEEEGEIRILVYGHYRIAYLIHGKDRIDVLGVFHTALDIDRYL